MNTNHDYSHLQILLHGIAIWMCTSHRPLPYLIVKNIVCLKMFYNLWYTKWIKVQEIIQYSVLTVFVSKLKKCYLTFKTVSIHQSISNHTLTDAEIVYTDTLCIMIETDIWMILKYVSPLYKNCITLLCIIIINL